MEQENNVGLSGEGDTSFIFSKPEWFEIVKCIPGYVLKHGKLL